MGFRDWLNDYSGHLIDWNRVGGNFFTQGYHYNRHELSQRSFIILSSAIFGYFSWNIKNSKQDAGIGLTLGLLWSHSITMYPLVQKRLAARSSCNILKDELIKIYSKEDLKDILPLVTPVIEAVITHKSSTSSSAIWSKRKQLMTTLVEWSQNESLAEDLPQLLEQDNIIELLSKNTPVISQIKINPC